MRAEIQKRKEQAALEQARREAERIRAECQSLSGFAQNLWHIVEPATPLRTGYAFDAICEHLEAVTYGDIKRLLINVPPGSTKSFLSDVFWPMWEWTACGMPHLRYVSFSYSKEITERDNRRSRDIIESQFCRELWPIDLTKNTERLLVNTASGFKRASSVGGVGTGERGDRVILDDPHNVREAESDLVRKDTVEWFRSAMSNRLNDLDKSAIVVVMQRVHADDVSGYILSKDLGYDHLMIQAEYDPLYHFTTSIGWTDWRRKEGESFWPERFPKHVLEKERIGMGSLNYAGQYQQIPATKGGEIIKRAHWQHWGDLDNPDAWENSNYPLCDLVIASLDPAYTEKQQNDPCALTLWGVFRDKGDVPRAIMMRGWRQRLEFNALIERTHKTCKDFRVDKLLIESKANGISVAQELRRRYSNYGYSVELIDPRNQDKVARAYGVQSIFESGSVFAPITREWAEMVITECEQFPRGKHDDLVDTVTQALRWLRDRGFLVRTDEHQASLQESMMHRGAGPKPLYPGMRRAPR